MSQTITEAAERPKLFDGFFTENEMLTETGWSYRTLKRREDDGLPVVKLGFTKLYIPSRRSERGFWVRSASKTPPATAAAPGRSPKQPEPARPKRAPEADCVETWDRHYIICHPRPRQEAAPPQPTTGGVFE
jgi:hypothetical protein